MIVTTFFPSLDLRSSELTLGNATVGALVGWEPPSNVTGRGVEVLAGTGVFVGSAALAALWADQSGVLSARTVARAAGAPKRNSGVRERNRFWGMKSVLLGAAR